jgi:hypothetical protein
VSKIDSSTLRNKASKGRDEHRRKTRAWPQWGH